MKNNLKNSENKHFYHKMNKSEQFLGKRKFLEDEKDFVMHYLQKVKLNRNII